ncbi:MAG: tRNA (adenosine(37)-N6)-threonylcarbamoyltransferase complex ATPase subunit type 1 TsaE [Myxococcota bacterium]
MASWTFVSRDPDETRAIARELGRAIGADGAVLALIGPLGAGKTVFVKGLAEGLGVDPRGVSSPTFVIAQQYAVPEGPEALHHVDLYRLEEKDELVNIGFDDMLAPGGVLAVEWADRFPGVLGRDHLRIELEGPSVAEADGTESAEDRPKSLGRRALVRAEGVFSERVAQDWFDRVEARAGGGAEAGGFERLAALVMVFFASLALLAGAYESYGTAWRGVVPPCPRVEAHAGDEFGTRRIACVEGRGGQSDLRGVARLVNGERIDLNQASASWLETLPGIGPARAGAIVTARSMRPFRSVADLESVPGIGPVTRARLAAFVEVRSEGEGRHASG